MYESIIRDSNALGKSENFAGSWINTQNSTYNSQPIRKRHLFEYEPIKSIRSTIDHSIRTRNVRVGMNCKCNDNEWKKPEKALHCFTFLQSLILLSLSAHTHILGRVQWRWTYNRCQMECRRSAQENLLQQEIMQSFPIHEMSIFFYRCWFHKHMPSACIYEHRFHVHAFIKLNLL